jgi:hypothetical protein
MEIKANLYNYDWLKSKYSAWSYRTHYSSIYIGFIFDLLANLDQFINFLEKVTLLHFLIEMLSQNATSLENQDLFITDYNIQVMLSSSTLFQACCLLQTSEFPHLSQVFIPDQTTN